MAIHPAQVPVINEVFAPAPAALERARAIVAAFAADPGAGVIGLEGEMVDRPHLKRAERLLSRRAVGLARPPPAGRVIAKRFSGVTTK
jgi:citrate lyase subunit beta/citryl-CoA lyase